MDWDKLRIFHVVAEAGSFTAAGEKMNLSQSSVSRQIIALEEDLGVTLFHRHARGLLLTEQGEILQKTAQDVFKKLTVVQGRIQDTRNLSQGPLVVTVSDFIGNTWLTPRIKDFNDSYPDIQLTVLFDDHALDIGMREADVALRLHQPKDPELIQRRLTTINFHICASKEYLKKHGAPETLEDLHDHTLIAFPPDVKAPLPNPGWLFDLVGVNYEENNNLVMMNSMGSIHRMVEAGLGVAVLPDYLIAHSENLEVLLPDYIRPPVDMFFVYASERRDSTRINAFRDFLLKTIDATWF